MHFDTSKLLGLELTKGFQVEPQHLASRVGSGALNVLSTPSVLAFAENASVAVLKPRLSRGQTSVGIAALVRHLAPVGVGRTVEFRARVESFTGTKIVFQIVGSVDSIDIAKIEHTRAVVEIEPFLEKTL